MAASLRPNLQVFTPPPPTIHRKFPQSYSYIRCGRRDNRGPLLKGRILSKEAIQAVQSLKRIHRTNLTESQLSGTLSRLIKSDLIATFKELLRQGQTDIAVKAFSAVRSEYHPELSLYADLITALGKDGLNEEIDEVIKELEAEEGRIQYDDKGMVKLIRALIGADRVELTVRIYGLLKKSGWGSTSEMNENVAKLLIRGLKRLGEEELADEIEVEMKRYDGVLENSGVQNCTRSESSS